MAEENSITPHRLTLFKIGEELDESEVERLLILCQDFISKSERENVKTGHNFIQVLEKMTKVSEGNLQFLRKLLTLIKRVDLINEHLDSDTSFSRTSGSFGHDAPSSHHQAGQTVPTPHRQKSLPANGVRVTPASTTEGPKLTASEYWKTLFSPAAPKENIGGKPKTLRSLSEASATGHNIKQRFNTDDLKGEKQVLASRQSLSNLQGRSDVSPPLSFSWTSGSFGHDGPSSHHQAGQTAPSPHRQKSLPANGDRFTPDDSDLQTDSPCLPTPRGRAPAASSHSQPSSAQQGPSGAACPQSKMSISPFLVHGSPPNIQGKLSPLQASHQVASIKPAALPRDDVQDASLRVQQASSGAVSKRRGQEFPLLDLSTDSLASSGLAASRQIRPPDGTLDAIDALAQRMERMMDQQETRQNARLSDRAVPTLRAYQKELARLPLHKYENYIICAPTGSGKTLTAAHICREYWNWFHQQQSIQKHFKTLFIVNMRHLTRQQRDAFQKYFPERNAVETISDQETFVEALKIDKPLPLILMVTAQVFVNALKSLSVRLGDVAMLIFDECHHTDLKHPYNEIMKRYLKEKKSLPRPPLVGVSGDCLPFVIGLSASLGVGGDPMGHLLKLCANMDAMGVARVLENEEELERHVNSPVRDTIRRVSRREPAEREYGRLLERLMAQIEEELPGGKGDQPMPEPGSQAYEGEARRHQIEAEESADRTAVIIYMYLYQYNRALMLYEDLRISDSLTYLKKFHEQRRRANQERVPVEDHCNHLFQTSLPAMKAMSDQEAEHSNQMLEDLAFRLQEVFTDKPESKGIILARTKLATVALTDFIMKSTFIQALPCRVQPLRFVGQGEYEDDCMTEAEQRLVLESFRDEDGCNVLVATDIAQEGLDMPACNFVIRYNFVSNEIGTVQSKGRARAEGSKCYLIVESGSLNEKREMDNRYRVMQMAEAMTQLEAMTENDRMQKITQKQEEILEQIRWREEEAGLRRSQQELDKITVHCKECSALICKASELRRKGDAGHVTCIRPNFRRQIREVRYNRPQRFRDTETLGLVYCGTGDCRSQLGTIQNFLLLSPPRGYALKATSFKVRREDGLYKTMKQWKKAGFEILQDAGDHQG